MLLQLWVPYLTLEQGLPPAVGGPGFPSDTKERKHTRIYRYRELRQMTGAVQAQVPPLHGCEATSWAFQNAVKQARHRQGVVSAELLMPSRVFPQGAWALVNPYRLAASCSGGSNVQNV